MTVENFDIEVRYVEDETRQSPGRLTGVLMTYETRARDRNELFEDGAFEWEENGILINEQHNRQCAPVVRAIPSTVEGRAVRIDTPLPNTTRGRDAAVNLREGVLTGLSVEFRAIKQRFVGGVRRIQRARLVAAALVDTIQSYPDSVAEVRAAAMAKRDVREYARWL